MARPLALAMTAFLLCSVSSTQHLEGNVPFPAAATMEKPCVLTKDEHLMLRIPAIDLEAELKPARVVGARLDASGMRCGYPVLVSPAAHPLLGRPGEVGVALILGHRQWRARPLVFARLDRLAPGDSVVVAGGGISLAHVVTGQIEIDPRRIWEVVEETGRQARKEGASVLILVTCAPYGGNWRRLLVFAACRGVEEDVLARGGDHPRPQ
ncbi:MAG: sortase [Firmicutes bacterium]|nr:sortase [Bacillota bacterium]